jgi:phosphatidylserine decarboxylase
MRLPLKAGGQRLTLVPVAAILIAGIRLRFQDSIVDPRLSVPPVAPVAVAFEKGQEMGWFEHGSTILVLAPAGTASSETIRSGINIFMGETLMVLS